MVSLLISREFIFAFNLAEEELAQVLAKVNKKSKNAHYLRTKAAMELCRATEKTQRIRAR